jgi:hypothetical protein
MRRGTLPNLPWAARWSRNDGPAASRLGRSPARCRSFHGQTGGWARATATLVNATFAIADAFMTWADSSTLRAHRAQGHRHLALVPQAQGGRPSRLDHLCGGNAGPHGSSRNPQSWPHPQAGGRTGGDVPTKPEGGFPLSAVTCIWLNTSACICCDAPVDGVYTVTVHCCGLEATSRTGYWT